MHVVPRILRVARLNHVGWLSLALVLGLTTTPWPAPAADEPAAASTDGAKALFRWKFKPGEKLVWNMDQSVEMSMIVGKMPITTTMDYEFSMSWAINEVSPEGDAQCSLAIDQIVMRMKIAEQEIVFNTNNKDAKPEGPLAAAADVFYALVGLTYDLTMTPRGEVKAVDFNDAAREKLKKLQANPAMGQLAQMFSAEGLKQMIGQASSMFPEEEVAVGQTWEIAQEVKNPLLGSQKTTAKMKYEGVEDVEGRPLDKISVDMQMNLGDLKLPNVDKFEMTNQENRQVIYFDREAGRLSATETISHMTMKITAMGQSLEQQIDGKGLVTCKPAEAAKAETPASTP